MPDTTVATTSPERPPDSDPRFTLGLVLDVARVLEQHGYPPIAKGRELVDLQVALFRFLYGAGGPGLDGGQQ
jgi:hypothetical protein